jgi:hypothetical protein
MYICAFDWLKDDNKMDRVLKETEGSHQLIGHIAQRVFRYDWEETQRLESHGRPVSIRMTENKFKCF